MIPDTAQAVFDAVARERRIPWVPEDMDPEAHDLTWAQLVRENRVPAKFGGLIDALQGTLNLNPDPLDLGRALRAFAIAHNLDPSACTL